MPQQKLRRGNADIETLDFEDQAENFGGPRHQWSTDNSRITRPIRCAYSDIKKAVRVFLGYPLLIGTVGGRDYISRAEPAIYPNMTDLYNQPWLYAMAIERGDGVAVYRTGAAPEKAPRGEKAQMHVVYSGLPYEVKNDFDPIMMFDPTGSQNNPLSSQGAPDEATFSRYCEIHLQLGSRTLSIPRPLLRRVYEANDISVANSTGGSYVLASVGTEPGPPIMEGISRQEGTIVLKVTHYEVPIVPYKAIENCIGTISPYPLKITPLRIEIAAKILVYQAPEIKPIRLANGARAWNITHTWKGIVKRRLDGSVASANQFLQVFKRKIGANVKDSLDYREITSTGLSRDLSADNVPAYPYPPTGYDHCDVMRPPLSSDLL